MARGDISRANFNINITGVKDAKELAKLLPKLTEQMRFLAKAQREMESAQGGGGSGRSRTSRQDVSEGIAGMELRVLRGEIDSVQQLSAAYGSLSNQINALERQGKATNALRVRAEKQHQKLRAIIDARVAANNELAQSERNLTAAESDNAEVVQRNIGIQNEMASSQQRSAAAITQTSDTYQNSAYVALNAGYLLQDSPYGFRGISNNISQLVQAWELLGRRTAAYNQTTGATLTTWQSLRRDLTGRVGLVFLLGSALPAALVLAERAWTAYQKKQEEAKGSMEDLLSIVQDYINVQRELTTILGEDPLGILEAQQTSADISNLANELLTYKAAVDEVELSLHNAFFEPRWTDIINPLAGLFQRLVVDTKSAREEIEVIGKEFGDLSKVEFDALIDEIEKIERKLLIQEELIKRSPILQLQQEWSRNVQEIVQDINLFSDEVFNGEMLDETRKRAQEWIRVLENEMRTGSRDIQRLAKPLADTLRDAISTDEEGTETEEQNIIEDQYDFREQRINDIIALQLHEAQVETDLARTTTDQIEAIWAEHEIMIRQLGRETFESREAEDLAYIQLQQETADRIDELRREQVLFEIEMENILLQRGIDNPNSLDRQLQDINAFYDNRADIIRRSVDNELEQKRRLQENEQERVNAGTQAEQTYQDRRQQLIQQGSEFAITSGLALHNILEKDREKQWRAQQIASASMAIINGHLAFTKTIAEGGWFATPLAALALASGYTQAALIMSQQYRGRGSRGGSGGGASALTSYRGFDVSNPNETGQATALAPFRGSDRVNEERTRSETMFPRTVRAQFTDGFGKVVSNGTLELQSKGKSNLNYWQDN